LDYSSVLIIWRKDYWNPITRNGFIIWGLSGILTWKKELVDKAIIFERIIGEFIGRGPSFKTRRKGIIIILIC